MHFMQSWKLPTDDKKLLGPCMNPIVVLPNPVVMPPVHCEKSRVIIKVQLQVKCGLGFNSKKQSTVTLVPFNLGCTISCKTISTGVGQVLIFKNNHWVFLFLF
jgi:hypothetical protein